MSNEEDQATNIEGTVDLREQQVRAKGLFAMLAKGLQLNLVSRAFINKYFQVDYVSVVPEDYHQQQEEEEQLRAQQEHEQQELLQPHLEQLLQLEQTQLKQTQLEQTQLLLQLPQQQRSPCRKRRLSI